MSVKFGLFVELLTVVEAKTCRETGPVLAPCFVPVTAQDPPQHVLAE